jgi:hypothetical protein
VGRILDDDETLTAYHEAGHAVIAFALGGVVAQLQLGGESEIEGVRQFGDCRIEWGRVDPQFDWQLQREVLTVLAGPVAEMVYRGEDLHPACFGAWQEDWRQAWEMGRVFGLDPTRRAQVLWQWMVHLKQLIQSEPCWPAVAALADALLAHEFLEREEAEEILEFWLGGGSGMGGVP